MFRILRSFAPRCATKSPQLAIPTANQVSEAIFGPAGGDVKSYVAGETLFDGSP
jgi:hypothetical protein